MDESMVSIVLPTYNRAHILGRAIESVLCQTYPYFELIIVDDGSTDNTERVVLNYQDSRIRYYKLKENGGQAAARNFGIEQANYDYIAFEDSDDIWHEEKLAIQMECLMNAAPEVGFVYHKIRYDMGNANDIIIPLSKGTNKEKSGDIYDLLLLNNLVGCPSILAKKECVMWANGFDVEMKSLEDYDFVLKMAKKYHAIFIDKVLLEATYSTSGVSGNTVNYLMASCYLLQKYKNDYIRTNILNYKIERILSDAEEIGMKEQFVKIMELRLRLR